MGILDAPALTPAAAAKKYAAAELASRRNPAFAGIQVTDVTYLTVSEAVGVNASAGTSRTPYLIATDCGDLRLTFANWYSNVQTTSPVYADQPGPAPLPVKASIAISGVLYPVTFRGATTTTIDPGGYSVSDPLPVDLNKGDIIEVRAYTSATGWRGTRSSAWANGGGGFAAGDLTAQGAAAVADSYGVLLAPSMITGTPKNKLARSVLGVGDSIANGVGDASGGTNTAFVTTSSWRGGAGFLNRALRGNIGYSSIALPGDQAQRYVSFFNSNKRRMFQSQFTDAICEYGRNDVSNAQTLAQVQSNLMRIWNSLDLRGVRVWQTTITPYTTSTDGWSTTANQSYFGGQSVEDTRVALNTWVRAGAPIALGVAVAVGTSGAILAGQPGHPLYGYFETADAVESARNSGFWKPASRVVTDAAITAGQSIVTSATANFTSADLLKPIAIAGAGSGGAYFYATITTLNSATSANLSTTAITTVSGASAGINIYANDGLHPNVTGAIALAAAIDTSRIV